MDFNEIDRAVTQALDNGERDYEAGLSRNDNPYPPGTLSFDLWVNGWDRGLDNEQIDRQSIDQPY